MTDRRNRSFQVIETEWIPLSDGTKLAARIWMPDAAETEGLPAILEYLPYQRRDGTSQRDDATYPAFAEAGYVGVRVDLRGSGDSEGIFDDEYSPRELADAVEVIAWIAAQPWCSGKVGMMGISWGGFNALQVAALRPPALKAVIALSTTVDRFNDDIHYKGGAQLSAQHYWSSNMLNNLSRPLDPAVVGEAWRERWLARLETLEPPIHGWLAHQRRDDFWRHGSICENYAALEAAALVIGGWADGYRNAPPAAAANLTAPAKALCGPWIHKYPHFAWPKPRVDFLAEAIAWWDRWLKDDPNGAETLPSYRAFISEGVRPALWRDREPGRWVAVGDWTGQPECQTYYLGTKGSLATQAGIDGQRVVASPQDCGLAAGEFFTVKPDAELSGDQRGDDAGSLVFDSLALEAPLDILGRPQVTLRLSVDRPLATVVVRLCDLHPDGTVHRVSFGVLNLAHRCSQAEPRPMIPGQETEVTVALDESGYRFLPGHRIRLSLSTAYFPLVLPPPEAASVTLTTGAASHLALPLLQAAEEIALPEPENPAPLPDYPEHRPAVSRRWVERDLSAGRTHYHIEDDGGEQEQPDNAMRWRETRHETWSIAWDDPATLEGRTLMTTFRKRGEWEVRTEIRGKLTTDGRNWILDHSLSAFVGEEEVFAKTWHETIARDLM
ncbi:MAG: CocE/NonD family hydrolase [Rhodospirillales bacterium]